MIPVKDLRIGNLVNTPNPNMNPFKVEYIEQGAEIEKVGGHNGIASFVYWYCKDIQSIPLTEEWLLKFGFEPEGSGYNNSYLKSISGRMDFRVDLSDKDYPICALGYRGYPQNEHNLRHIKYVHQIQNFWPSYEGEELTIKELL